MTRALEEALLQHFICQKLQISYAIDKTFPFFEGLRDSSFITERMYRESLEAHSNQVPVSRLVYNILTKLEKTFNLSLLEMLFSRINLCEYPKLKTILESFKNVVTSYGGGSRTTPILLEVPANPAERSSHKALLPLPPTQHPPPKGPPCAPRVSEPGASTQHSVEIPDEPPSPSGPAVARPKVAQEERITPASSDNLKPQIKVKEDTQEMPCAPSGPVQGKRDLDELSSSMLVAIKDDLYPFFLGKKRKRNVWSIPKKRYQKKSLPKGKTRLQEETGDFSFSPGDEIQEKLQVVDQATQKKDDTTRNSKVTTRVQKARTGCAQTSGPEEVSDDASEVNEGRRPQEPPSTPPGIMHDPMDNGSKQSLGISPGKKRTSSAVHEIQQKLQVMDQATQRMDDSTGNSEVMARVQKARTGCVQMSASEDEAGNGICRLNAQCGRVCHGAEQLEDETVDFHSSELPVTCGEAKGILYKEKLEQGVSEKCIQNEKGVWFTPKEFEAEGKRAHAKNWKRSVHCGGKTLEQLLKKRLLHCPSRKSLKRERENSKECEVCCRGGPLLCCDTCLRAFHEDCHIPPAEAERSPWSCTFCRMRESSGSQQCHRESEVLARRMRPEEQLKCEFLLLKAYCHPQSSFFAETPCNIRDYGEPFKEAMWLDLVKERLTEKIYTVEWFVRDMRLIFRNHKTFYKASSFGQVGLDLEAEFEKDLKDVLIFHK
uniref:SP110 nuclear body protein n=1 Tax=Equus asinus asinus TaxID=83772 RepID=A0A8C4LHI0_EQUAS